MPRFTLLLLTAGMLLFAACDGNGGDGAAAFEGGRGPVEVPGGVAPPVLELVDVRSGRHEGFDRVVSS